MKRFRFAQISLMLSILLTPSASIYASGLTDLFNTAAFQGSWAIFDEMNVVGRIMCWVISAFSLIGIFTVGLRLMCSLLYLSGRTIWDNVADIKSATASDGLFKYATGGVGDLFGSMGKLQGSGNFTKNGSGVDIVINFVLGLFPNIKMYSEYGDLSKSQIKGLQEDDTVTSYLLKSALSYIMIIFAFTMGFNGTLWQAYGKIVEGMGNFAQHVVESNLTSVVDSVCNKFGKYNFGYADSGTALGSFEQSLANNIYAQVLAKCEDRASTDVKQTIGANIDAAMPSITLYAMNAMYGKMTLDDFEASYGEAATSALKKVITDAGGTAPAGTAKVASLWGYGAASDTGDPAKMQTILAKMEQNGCAPTKTMVDNLVCDVVINSTPSYSNAKNLKLSDLGLTASKQYLHIMIYKKASADDTMYFHLKDNAESSGTKDSSATGDGSIQIVQ